MPDSLRDNPGSSPQPLTRKEVLKGIAASGLIGLGLVTLGVVAIVLLGALGAMSGNGAWAVAVGLACVLLMAPSALLLGLGIQCLRLSAAGINSLIFGKPVYGFTVIVDFRHRPSCEP